MIEALEEIGGFLLIIGLPVIIVFLFLGFRLFYNRVLLSLFLQLYDEDPFKANPGLTKSWVLTREMFGLCLFFLIFATVVNTLMQIGNAEFYHGDILFMMACSTCFYQVYRIDIIEDKYIRFFSALKNLQIPIEDITSLRRGDYFYKLTHKKGVIFINHVTHYLPDFSSRLRSLNKDISELKEPCDLFDSADFDFGFLIRVLSCSGLLTVCFRIAVSGAVSLFR